jgi:hypothetical protein
MSHGARLGKLEAVVTVTRTDRGSHCRDCGGLTITDALWAYDTIERGSKRMTIEEAGAVFDVLGAGADSCRRCGADTLKGALRRHCPKELA